MDVSLADVAGRVDDHVETYRESAPFYPVESEAIASLPAAFRAGEYGNRDVEWVVRWYFRRAVTDVDHAERRAVEDAVADTEPRELRGAMWDAVDALDGEGGEVGEDGPPAAPDGERPHHRALDALSQIRGVDVGVASALLWFLAPEEYLVVGEREWAVVAALTAGARFEARLDDAYPEPMTVEAYDRYLDAVAGLTDRLGVDPWRLYMVIRSVDATATGRSL